MSKRWIGIYTKNSIIYQILKSQFVVVVVAVGFFGSGCYHTARSIWSINHIRVSGKFLCTDHAEQGTFGYSGLQAVLVSGKVGRVFEKQDMRLSFGGVLRISQFIAIYIISYYMHNSAIH
jgi:hypothetical protein